MTPPAVTITEYQPHTSLDNQLVALGRKVLAGWPDTRPVTTSLVRSRLRPTGTAPATLLAVCRDEQTTLLGAAALRYPGHPGAPGRLWGPVVDPNLERAGIGTALLTALTPYLNGFAVTSAEVPASRARAVRFFDRAGWTRTASAHLLTRPLPIDAPDAAGGRVEVWPAGERDVRDILARLYADTYPDADQGTATATFDRWRADERYRPEHLHLAETDDGTVAAALLYLLAADDHTEPAEVLIGDVLTRQELHAAGAAVHELLLAGLRQAGEYGARVARAIVTDTVVLTVLHDLGFQRADDIYFFQPTDNLHAADRP